MHTYLHTYIHLYIHTSIYIYIYTWDGTHHIYFLLCFLIMNNSSWSLWWSTSLWQHYVCCDVGAIQVTLKHILHLRRFRVQGLVFKVQGLGFRVQSIAQGQIPTLLTCSRVYGNCQLQFSICMMKLMLCRVVLIFIQFACCVGQYIALLYT